MYSFFGVDGLLDACGATRSAALLVLLTVVVSLLVSLFLAEVLSFRLLRGWRLARRPRFLGVRRNRGLLRVSGYLLRMLVRLSRGFCILRGPPALRTGFLAARSGGCLLTRTR